jgi:hypothetical protein
MRGDRTPSYGDRTPMRGDRTPLHGDRTPLRGDQTPAHDAREFNVGTPNFQNQHSPYSPYASSTPHESVCIFFKAF